MMHSQRLQPAVRTARPPEAPFGHIDLLNSIRLVFIVHGMTQFRTITEIDRIPETYARRISTEGNVFDVFVDKLIARGIPTKRTIGGVMDSLNLNFKQIQHIARPCSKRDHITSSVAAMHLNNIDQYRL